MPPPACQLDVRKIAAAVAAALLWCSVAIEPADTLIRTIGGERAAPCPVAACCTALIANSTLQKRFQ